MESNFDNREFEQYVKRNADQYRMIPSEKVWKGISNNLHLRRRWYGLGLVFLLLGTAVAVTWVMLSYPSSGGQNIGSAEKVQAPANKLSDNLNKTAVINLHNISNNLFKNNPDKKNEVAETVTTTDETASVINNELISLPESDIKPDPLVNAFRNIETSSTGYTVTPAANKSEISPEIISADMNHSGENHPAHPAPLILSEKKSGTDKYFPLTIESVVNSYHAKSTNFKKKISWQVYFTPTVSYRKLSDNKSFKNSSFFFNNQGYGYPFAPPTDVNKAVTHKPDLGLELGISGGYPLTSNLKLTGGLQFNINRYDIRAYIYNREQATINLNGNGGNSNNSMTTWTSYRNYNGYKSDWLKNFYFSVSAPVGAELKLFGNNKTNYGIAGSVQPTYVLRGRAYLISTDYKNYAEVPDLIRHFNVNTSFEAFVSYKTRNTRWQIGPQVRYQVLSSFQDKYPIKENLFDFGLKVGISLNH